MTRPNVTSVWLSCVCVGVSCPILPGPRLVRDGFRTGWDLSAGAIEVRLLEGGEATGRKVVPSLGWVDIYPPPSMSCLPGGRRGSAVGGECRLGGGKEPVGWEVGWDVVGCWVRSGPIQESVLVVQGGLMWELRLRSGNGNPRDRIIPSSQALSFRLLFSTSLMQVNPQSCGLSVLCLQQGRDLRRTRCRLPSRTLGLRLRLMQKGGISFGV